MVKIHENFVIDEKGRKVGVFLKIDDYKKLVEEMEELDEIRAYDEAKASGSEKVSFEKAVREIEKKRK